ncbi:MAG: hypothetical protein IJ438_03390 [Clostridia bacterium]|nr:hypothetical protein [Clostridia bacterium]
MLREINVQRLHWADKTMSVLREQQLEACEKRLAALPSFGLFDGCTDVNVETLWGYSYDAQEHPQLTHLHTVHELRSQVLSALPVEAALLSIEEHMLLERLISLGGKAELMDWEETSAAESLVRRLWCTIHREENRIIITLPHELLMPLTMVLSTRQHIEIRERLLRHDAVIRALLYIGGLLHFEEPLYHLLNEVVDGTYAFDHAMAMRYLRTAYDYMYDRSGDMLLLHPGLADPEQMLTLHPTRQELSLELDEETMRGAMEGLLPDERPLFDQMYGLLIGATRPEIREEDAVEDLLILAKQGVSLREMQEVLAAMLTVQPTPEMRDAVAALHQRTPRWGAIHTEAVQ